VPGDESDCGPSAAGIKDSYIRSTRFSMSRLGYPVHILITQCFRFRSNINPVTLSVLPIYSMIVVWAKEVNVSYTITPCGVVCGLQTDPPVGPICRWTTFRLSIPPHAGAARSHPVHNSSIGPVFRLNLTNGSSAQRV